MERGAGMHVCRVCSPFSGKDKNMAKNAAVPKRKFKKEWLKGYLFILPIFVGFLIFMGIPIIMGLIISFTNYDGFKTFDFVGLSNYIKMFKDEYFQVSFVNNLIYTGVTVPCTILIALLLAVALNVGIKGTGLFRTMFFFPNISSMVEAIPALTTEKTIKMFEEFKVFTRAELESRAEIKFENYSKAINIEARTMIDMASKQIIPAVIKYTKTLADTVISVKEAGADASVQAELLTEVSSLLNQTKKALEALIAVTDQASSMEEGADQARFYHSDVVPAMAALRAPVDELEMIVDKEAWPMPSYGDLIFEV